MDRSDRHERGWLPDIAHAGHRVQYNTGTGFGPRVVGSWTNPGFPMGVGRLRDYTKVTTGTPGSEQTTTDTWADMIDGNGDGCPDKFVISNGTWYYFRNLKCSSSGAAAGLADPVVWTWPGTPPAALSRTEGPADGDSSRTTSGFIEINGDGLIDYFGNGAFYFGTGTGFVVSPGYTHSWLFVVNGGPLSVYRFNGWHFGLLDVNGDGRADVVSSNADLEWFMCVKDGGPVGCEGCPRVHDQNWRVWLNTGSRFAPESP